MDGILQRINRGSSTLYPPPLNRGSLSRLSSRPLGQLIRFGIVLHAPDAIWKLLRMTVTYGTGSPPGTSCSP
jgi:hypothetical protein